MACAQSNMAQSVIPLCARVSKQSPMNHLDTVLKPRPAIKLTLWSAMYYIQALWSAAQLQLPIMFIILNNRRYAALQEFVH